MASLWSPGELPFGLRRGYVAPYTPSSASYGTPVRVPSVKVASFKIVTQNRDLQGDDGITATSTRAISADITCQMGGLSLAVIDVLNGSTTQSSGGANFYRRMHVSNRRFPYFGFQIRVNDDENPGDQHVFAPKCKVTDGYELRFEYEEFSIPELHFRAVLDENFLDETGLNSDIFYTVNHNFLLDIVSFPPSYP